MDKRSIVNRREQTKFMLPIYNLLWRFVSISFDYDIFLFWSDFFELISSLDYVNFILLERERFARGLIEVIWRRQYKVFQMKRNNRKVKRSAKDFWYARLDWTRNKFSFTNRSDFQLYCRR